MESLLVLGLKVQVEEIKVTLKAVNRKTTAVMPNGTRQSNWPQFFHSLHRLTSIKTGKQWAMDIGGGQFGICQVLWQWEEYEAKFVENVTARYPSSTMKQFIGKLSKIRGTPSLTYGLTSHAAAVLNESIRQWEQQHMTLAKLAALEPSSYDFMKQDLLKFMKEAVHSFITNADFTKQVRKERVYEAVHPGTSQIMCDHMLAQLRSLNLQPTRNMDPGYEALVKNSAPGTAFIQL